MRLTLAIVLGCLAGGIPVGSAFAQITYPSYPVGEALDQILLDTGKEADPVIFPEEVVRSQARRTTAFFTTLLNQRTNIPPCARWICPALIKLRFAPRLAITA